MRKFIVSILLFSLLLTAAAEVFLSVSGLASDVIDRKLNEAGILVYQPGAAGNRTRGMRAEVNAAYHINRQGWNSSIDYDQVDENTIAIVGDSYIAGFWNDVDSTVGACLQRMVANVQPGIEVHSYGHPGSNFYDYENLTVYLRTLGYQNIYLYVGAKDFSDKKPSFTNQTQPDKRTGIRYWYRKSALLRYLNVNLGIKESLTSRKNQRKDNNAALALGREKTLARLHAFPGEDVVIVYQENFFTGLKTRQQLLKVVHHLQPIDHGFNRHWNVNGNKNAARTIFEHWESKSNH